MTILVVPEGYTEDYRGFECPACRELHIIPIRGPRAWEWNGDPVRPTLAPSLLVRMERLGGPTPRICHSFVRDGSILFLNDCTHALAGQTVPLVPPDPRT